MKGVYAFHSADSKSGVTMIAQSVAEYVAKARPDLSVLLLSLCPKSNHQFIENEKTDSLDNFKCKIESSIAVSRAELEERKLSENLYYIDGLDNEREGKFYFPDMTVKFIEKLALQFDLLILDTGSNIDSGLSAGGLASAESIYMILSQNDASIERYIRQRRIYDALDFSFDAYVINKYDESDIFDIGYIKKRVIPAHRELYVVRDTGRWREAEYERKTFYELKDRKYERDISCIAKAIMRGAGLEINERGNKTKWKRSILNIGKKKNLQSIDRTLRASDSFAQK